MRRSQKSNSNLGSNAISPKKSPQKKSQMVAISLKEYREQQRIAENAHVGPGSTEHQKPFASEKNHMTIFGKYKSKYPDTPGPGIYEPEDAIGQTLPRSQAALIKEDNGYKVPRENAPDPGQYDSHLTPFGHNEKQMTIGGKYKFVPDSNPAPGQYEPEGAVGVTKPRSYAAVIKEENGYRVPRENSPDPGQYDAHLRPFGTLDQAMTIGGKYKFVPDQNPAPGQYEPEGAVGVTKPRTQAAIIKEENGYRVPRENAPDPGQYDGHIKPFGRADFEACEKNITIGGKYKFVPDSNPAPGQYEPEGAAAVVKPRSKAAYIKEESGYKVPRENSPDPGQYSAHLTPFGTNDKAMTIGGKYKFVPDQNPAPGQYEPEGAVGVTKPRTQAAIIKEENGYRVPRENSPDPGQYDAHLTPFGTNDKAMTIGGKYKFVPDQNPAPGQYEPEGAVGVTKPRSYAAVIKEENGYRVPRENAPDPGQYDGHLKTFGHNERNMTIGGKYKFVPDSNPAPGQYEPEGAVGVTKPRTQAAIIKEENGYKVPRENSPDPGQYDAHLRPFGTNDKAMTIGGKYKFVPDSNPAPGQYEPEGAVGVTKPRSYAAVIKEENGYRVPRENAPDPGQYDAHLRPFGTNDKAMTIGGKYKFVPDSNPAPGQYEPEGAVGVTMPRSYAAVIKEESGYRVPRENAPDPGQYDGHLKTFGHNDKNMTIGGKYKFVPDQNPAPGQYEPEGAVGITKPRTQAAIIKEENGYRVPRENSPDPGQYDAHLRPFGTSDKAMTIGGKYKFVPDSNPAPGQYEPEGAAAVVKPRTQAAIIKEESGYRVPRENAPDPGQYDGHLRSFGHNERNMTIGGKYKFVPDSNPAPGQYQPEGAVGVTKPRSKAAIIKEDTGYRVPRENAPDPGQYDAHLKNFGHNERNMTIGGKYKFVPDQNPAPGQYEPSDHATKPRASTAAIRNPVSPSRRPLEHSPSPGDYSNMYAFGDDSKNVYIGEKLKYPQDQTPGPGQYEDLEAHTVTKSRVRGGKMHTEQMVMVDVNSLHGADKYAFKARAQSPGVRSSATMSTYNRDRASPIKPFASSLKRKKNAGYNSRLMQSIGKLKETTFNDLDQKQQINAARRGTEIKKKPTGAQSQDFDVTGAFSPNNAKKATLRSSNYSKTTASKTIIQQSSKKRTADYFR